MESCLRRSGLQKHLPTNRTLLTALRSPYGGFQQCLSAKNLSDFQEELDDGTGEVDYYYVDIEHGLNIDYVPIVSIIDYNTNETYVCSIEKIDNNKIRLKTLDTAKIIIKII